MTRKDYLLLSQALRQAKPPGEASLDLHIQHARDCVAVADELAAQSRGFDKVKFLTDAGAR